MMKSPVTSYGAIPHDDDPSDEECQDSSSSSSSSQRRRWVRTGALVVSGLAIVGSMGVVPLTTVAYLKQRSSSLTTTTTTTKRSKFCVAHAAYGEDYKSIAAVTAVTKQRYAKLHGYRFLEYVSDTLDDFVNDYCPELAGQIRLAYSLTTPVKSCGIWAALRDSCDYVFWTDADAVIVDSSIRMEKLLFMDEFDEKEKRKFSGGELTGKEFERQNLIRNKDVLFFLESYQKLGLCSGLTERPLALGSCGFPDEFGNCVNTGAVLMRSGEFTETLLRDQLALAVFDNDFLLESPCSTNDLGSGYALNLTWDQCMFRGETEQCTLSCLYRQNPLLFEKTMCQISDDNTTHYLFGTLLDPPPAAVQSFLDNIHHTKESIANTTDDYLQQVRDIGPPHPYKGTLVYNCMGGNFVQKMNCATFATYWLWPEMLPTDDYAPPRPGRLPTQILPEVNVDDLLASSSSSASSSEHQVPQPPPGRTGTAPSSSWFGNGGVPNPSMYRPSAIVPPADLTGAPFPPAPVSPVPVQPFAPATVAPPGGGVSTPATGGGRGFVLNDD